MFCSKNSICSADNCCSASGSSAAKTLRPHVSKTNQATAILIGLRKNHTSQIFIISLYQTCFFSLPDVDPRRQRPHRLPVGEVRYWNRSRSYLSVNAGQILAQTALQEREYRVSRGRRERRLATCLGPCMAPCRWSAKLPVDFTVRQRVLQLPNGRRGDLGAQ